MLSSFLNKPSDANLGTKLFVEQGAGSLPAPSEQQKDRVVGTTTGVSKLLSPVVEITKIVPDYCMVQPPYSIAYWNKLHSEC